MELGAFSISLNVKDIAASRAFYRALGFVDFAGDAGQGWLILRNGSSVIGLFRGMIARNTLTFNPGWGQAADPLAEFQDIRDIQAALKAMGLKLESEAEAQGPASLVLHDPDGNPVLIDQHVPAPSKPKGE